MNKSRSLCLASAIMLAGAPWCAAVIIRGGDGTGNTTSPTIAGGAPANVTGWANVGSVGNGSVVYLGNGWALTAAHVNRSTPVNFGGIDYATDQVYRLHEPNSTTLFADLVMLHLSTTPNINPLTLATTSPTILDTVTIIGAGLNRDPNLTYYKSDWSVTTQNAIPPYAHSGYLYAAGNTKRWGTNLVSGGNTIVDITFGKTIAFSSTFDAIGGTGNNEGMVADGDSGGAAFVGSDTLAGILNAKVTYQNQPNGTALFGNEFYMVDVASYRPEIMTVIPEPSSLLLLGGVLFSAFLGRRHRAV